MPSRDTASPVGPGESGLTGPDSPVVPVSGCPNEAEHTPCPAGHVAWFVWAEEMSKTHQQVRCSSCLCFAIWVPKSEEEA